MSTPALFTTIWTSPVRSASDQTEVGDVQCLGHDPLDDQVECLQEASERTLAGYRCRGGRPAGLAGSRMPCDVSSSAGTIG